MTCVLHEMAPRSCSVTLAINPVNLFITIAALSTCSAEFAEKPPHVAPEFHELGLTGSPCKQITLTMFAFTWMYVCTRAGKQDGWLNIRARRRLRGRIRMWNEAVDRANPLSLEGIAMQAKIAA